MTTLRDAIFEAIVAHSCQSRVIEITPAGVFDEAIRGLSVEGLLDYISEACEKAGYDFTPVPEGEEQCDRCGGTGYAQADGLPCSGVCMNCQGLGTITGPPYGGTVSCGRCRGTGKEPTPPAKADRPSDPPTYRACAKCKPPIEE